MGIGVYGALGGRMRNYLRYLDTEDLLKLVAAIIFAIFFIGLFVACCLDIKAEWAKAEALKEVILNQGLEYNEFRYVTKQLEAAENAMEEAQKNTYRLSVEERDLIEQVVFAEAGNQGYYGMVLVAQCIRNACEIDDLRPEKAAMAFRYAEPKKGALEDVKRAVSAVFDDGFKVTELPIMYFYSTAGGFKSEWHETQEYVLTHKEHKFFARKEK